MLLTIKKGMEMKVSKLASASVVALAFVAGTAAADGAKVAVSISGGEKIFKNGKGDTVPACMSCHGEHGMGNDSMGTPRLANQDYSYIVKQLGDFAADKRTDTTLGVMNGIAKGLSDQDRKNLAIYLNKLEVPAELSDLDAVKADGKPVGITYEGQSISLYGIPAKGVSACVSCHAYNGRGSGPIYPMIGQQRVVYLVNQLNKWRDGSRANDPMGQMRAIAKNLTDADIANVATFLSHAPKSTEGDTMPHENDVVPQWLQITP